jgi:hypothetical protein
MYETLGEMAENGRKWQKMADIWQIYGRYMAEIKKKRENSKQNVEKSRRRKGNKGPRSVNKRLGREDLPEDYSFLHLGQHTRRM